MSYFNISRNIELSLLYYIETNFNTDWSGVTVLKSFKNVYAKDINIPIVCVELIDTITTRREIGTTTLEERYIISTHLFCRSNGQRLDFASYLKDKLSTGWSHYDHSHASGDNSNLVRTANGRDFVTNFITDSKIEFSENIDPKDKFRHNIVVEVRKST